MATSEFVFCPVNLVYLKLYFFYPIKMKKLPVALALLE